MTYMSRQSFVYKFVLASCPHPPPKKNCVQNFFGGGGEFEKNVFCPSGKELIRERIEKVNVCVWAFFTSQKEQIFLAKRLLFLTSFLNEMV